MSTARGIFAVLGFGLWISGSAAGQSGEPWRAAGAALGGGAPAQYLPKPLLEASVSPRSFGTQDYEVTVLSAARFYSAIDYATLSGYCPYLCEDGFHIYRTLDVPAGVVIDYIGVNTATGVDAAMGFTLHFRDHLGGTAQLVSTSIPAHASFSTDYVGPLGILVPANVDRVFVLDLEQAPGVPNGSEQYFGYFEIWWRRVVSDPPATPTFGDVPASHPFYQFIEALAKSGITGGCGSGNYCPDNPLTRGQMATFLAKALGLHWPQ